MGVWLCALFGGGALLEFFLFGVEAFLLGLQVTISV
jgi:hypothetical protein